jgi:hypothetical protein
MLKIDLVEGSIQVAADKLTLFNDGFYSAVKPSRKVFDKFVTFNEHYNSLDTKTKKIYDDLATLRGAKLRAAQNSVKNWYDSLVSDLTAADEIIEFVNLAENCGNETIYTLACFTLADDLDRLGTVDNIRTKYSIQNDLAEAEQLQLDKEDEIWSLIKDQ